MKKNKKGFYQGEYIVENAHKYIGKHNPLYRSYWESKFCNFLDNHRNIVKWGFEEIEIPYLNMVDKKIHRYITDFYFEEIDLNNNLSKYIAEVKPLRQTKPPKKPKNRNQKANKRFLYEAHTYIKNVCKWRTAEQYCNKRNINFRIVSLVNKKGFYNWEVFTLKQLGIEGV